MTLHEVTGVLPHTGSDTNIRAFAQAVDACLLQALVDTGDTGQTDLSTLLGTTSGGQSRGFRTYRFDDADQATYPIFLKVEFGSTTGSGTSTVTPALWVTIGTGTDGAGNITGELMARTHIVTNLSLQTQAQSGTVFISHAPGAFAMGLWVGNPTSAHCGPCFGVERFTHPSTRARLDNGGFFWCVASPSFERYRPFSPGTSLASGTSAANKLPVFRPFNVPAGIVDNQFPIYPLVTHTEDVNGPPTHLVAMKRGDVGAGSTFTFDMDSVTREFMSFGTTLASFLGLTDGVSGGGIVHSEMTVAIAHD